MGYYKLSIDLFGSLSQMDVQLKQYGVVVIQGQSGCGKSTFLNALLWLIDSHGSRIYAGPKRVVLETPICKVERAGSTHITLTLYHPELMNDPKFSNQEFCKEFVKKEMKYLAVWPDYKDFVNSSKKERLEMLFETFGISETYLKQCENKLTAAVAASSSGVDTLKKLIPSLTDTSNVLNMDVSVLQKDLDDLMNQWVTSQTIITQQVEYKDAFEKAEEQARGVTIFEELEKAKAQYSEHIKYTLFCDVINEIKSLSLNSQELALYEQLQQVGYDAAKHEELKKRVAKLTELGQCVLTCPQCDTSVVISSSGLQVSGCKRICTRAGPLKLGRTLEQEDELLLAKTELAKYDAFDAQKFAQFQTRLKNVEELKLKKAALGDPVGHPTAKLCVDKLEKIIREENLKPSPSGEYLANFELGKKWDKQIYEYNTKALVNLREQINQKREEIREAELATMNQNIKERYDEAVTTLQHDKRRVDIWERTKTQHVLKLCKQLSKMTNVFLSQCFDNSVLVVISPEKAGIDVSITYGLESRALREMSSGEKSRIRICLVLAMALMSKCKILILDEILNTLDEQNLSKCWDMICKFSLDYQILVLVASHQYLPNAHQTITF